MTPEDQQFMNEWLARWHQPEPEPPAVPDWMRCIICRVSARGGRIAHTRTCPEFRTRVRDRAAPWGSRGAAAVDVRDRYDRFVSALTMRRPDRFDCPSCGARGDGHGLKVDLAGDRILFHCFGCEGRDEILAAVGLSWADVGGVA